jgi:hypothetical protein
VLAAAAAVALPAAEKPFSHRDHLALRHDCASCHPRAASSTAASDNLLPAAAVCAACHQGGPPRPVKAPRALLVTRFNHKRHVAMGNLAPLIARAIDSGAYLDPAPPPSLRAQLNTPNACAGCHHGIETSQAVSAALFPRMADCLVCHNQVDPPFSCSQCHADSAPLKPSNHTPDFLDSHTRKNAVFDKSTCAVCHGRKFTCLGCH